MGKHDKKETIVIRTNVASDEYYRARIKALEQENKDLAREVEALEHQEEMLQGIIGELKEDLVNLKETVVRLAVSTKGR